jgi:hypothetical protein
MDEEINTGHMCQVHKNGVCAMHGVEIERRRTADKTIDKIANFVEVEIPSLIKKVNLMIGYSVLASILIIGSYYYTRETKIDYRIGLEHLSDDVKSHRSRTDSHITTMASQLTELTVAVTRTEEKQESLVRELKTLNGYLEILVKEKFNEVDAYKIP